MVLSALCCAVLDVSRDARSCSNGGVERSCPRGELLSGRRVQSGA